MGQLDQVPESKVLPKCDVIAKIAEMKAFRTSTEKHAYKSEFRVQDDGQGRFENTPIFENYLIGNDKDPEANETKTWIEAPGARNLKRLFKRLGLDTTKDVDDLIQEAEGQEIGLSIVRFEEPAKKKVRTANGFEEVDNPYAGTLRNRIVNYWTPGERTPHIYDDEDASTPASASSGASASKPSQSKAAAKGNGSADDDDVPAAKKQQASGGKQGNVVTCPQCEESVAKANFAQHVAQAHS